MNDLSLIDLVLKASLLVQIVMGLLLFASFISWTLIFRKSFQLARVKTSVNDFEEEFRSGKDINNLYSRLTTSEEEPTGMSRIFVAGYMEFARLRKQANISPEHLIDATQRIMRSTLSRESEKLDTQLTVLATIGSVSPYIGLFGTVWGIMHTFHALGGMQQVTLSMVAPGISEALIATAMGLFAAIPAVIAYNHYADQVDRIIGRYEAFIDDFTSVLNRYAHLHSQANAATLSNNSAQNTTNSVALGNVENTEVAA